MTTQFLDLPRDEIERRADRFLMQVLSCMQTGYGAHETCRLRSCRERACCTAAAEGRWCVQPGTSPGHFDDVLANICNFMLWSSIFELDIDALALLMAIRKKGEPENPLDGAGRPETPASPVGAEKQDAPAAPRPRRRRRR